MQRYSKRIEPTNVGYFDGTELGDKIAQSERFRADLRAKEWLNLKLKGELTRDEIKAKLDSLAPRAREATRKRLNELIKTPKYATSKPDENAANS